eukprot:2441792-Pyramimonas_sp.AAC.1
MPPCRGAQAAFRLSVHSRRLATRWADRVVEASRNAPAMFMHPYPPTSFSLELFEPSGGAKQRHMGIWVHLFLSNFSLGTCKPFIVPRELRQHAGALGGPIA